MIIDSRTTFAKNTTIVGAAGTALIGDVMPLTNVRDIGNQGARPLWLAITTGDVEIITAGAAGTVQFKLVSDAQAAIAVDGSATEHIVTPSFVTDDAAANSPLLNVGGLLAMIALPLEGNVYEAFLGILCVIGTTAISAGKINAHLLLDPTKWKAVPDGLPAGA